MPARSGSGWFSGPWHHCDCHQWQWPVSKLKRQDGLIVCPLGFDNPQRTRTVDARQDYIRQVLGNGVQEPELADILTSKEDNSDFF